MRTINLERFAELLNSQGILRDLWVKQKIREMAERARIVREKKLSKIINS
jgi:hypothetical protein